MNTTTDIIVVDRGPVLDAALILARRSTLADHVLVVDGDWTTQIRMNKEIPFELWGSGTQALWRLLNAISYTRFEVSLYEVISRLDRRNTIAVAEAIAALCEVDQ